MLHWLLSCLTSPYSLYTDEVFGTAVSLLNQPERSCTTQIGMQANLIF